MTPARTVVHPAFRVAPVERRLFGSFVEHLGRCVYTGIYEPGHPTADADGFRGDVLELTRELGATVVRYPGGNFVSGYRWEDTVGPRDERPARLDLAWSTTESNAFGLDEFIRWTCAAQAEPMMALNLGTRGVEAAIDLIDYANHPGGTALSDARIANGSPEPHDIRLWCLGNEMDGPWQIGHKTATEYGRLAAETARTLRRYDPTLEFVVCGSSGSGIATFGEWELEVLEQSYDVVDHISLHAYYQEHDGDRASFLASTVDMDHFIRSVVAMADAVGARKKSTKRLTLSFDEWNVWYQGAAASKPKPGWPEAPALLEDHYTAQDAVVVGAMLITLLRHSDRVAVACQAQLVNVIAPIMTEPGGGAWRQTIFHPFALTARHATGVVLDLRLEVDTLSTTRHGEVAAVDAVATWDEQTGELALFCMNRDPDAPRTLEADVAALGVTAVIEALAIAEDDPYARNSAAEPDRVVPRPASAVLQDGTLRVDLAPGSWAMVRVGGAPVAPVSA